MKEIGRIGQDFQLPFGGSAVDSDVSAGLIHQHINFQGRQGAVGEEFLALVHPGGLR